MPHPMKRRLSLLLLMLCTTLTCTAQGGVQIRRGPRTLVRGGTLSRPDTLARAPQPAVTAAAGAAPSGPLLDSLARMLAADSASRIAPDSLGRLLASPDSAAYESLRGTLPAEKEAARALLDSLRTVSRTADAPPAVPGDDELVPIDPARLDSLSAVPPQVARTEPNRRGRLFSDSMSLSKVCWTTAVLPGYGQIYNKQYWKLPILYGTLGAGIGLFIHENNTYRPLKRAYDEMVDRGLGRSPAFETIQERMIRSNTRRQLYLGGAVASYLYFIGDAAVSYATNDVSDVKKATTLACICPGAGQIYNKSYWKVPFVVGGFAAMIYCIDWNNRGYQRFKTAYARRARYENDPTSYTGPLTGDMSIQAKTLKTYKDSYRRNRDLCIILTAGLYVLQIVDAHVDAHLKDYDISDDLSMDLEPMVDYPYVPGAGGHRPVFGFNLNFNF